MGCICHHLMGLLFLLPDSFFMLTHAMNNRAWTKSLKLSPPSLPSLHLCHTQQISFLSLSDTVWPLHHHTFSDCFSFFTRLVLSRHQTQYEAICLLYKPVTYGNFTLGLFVVGFLWERSDSRSHQWEVRATAHHNLRLSRCVNAQL